LASFQQQEKVRKDNELRTAREEEREEEERRDYERRQREERERQERERKEFAEKEKHMNNTARREAEERRNREERDRIKQEALEREQMEKDKREREEQDRRQRREREERERRERERLEQERRAAEERRKFEEDSSIQAERKKKDEILQKLREIDEGVGKSKENPKSPNKNDLFFVTESVKEDSQDSMASSKKSYTFSKPTQNLHKGKPSHKDKAGFTVGQGQGRRNNRDVEDLTSGGYNPTFGSKTGGTGQSSTKPFSLFDDEPDKKTSAAPLQGNKKSKLMDDLFGSQASEGPTHNDMFDTNKQPAKRNNAGRSNAFPWSDDSSTNKNSTTTFKTTRDNSATLFGGGSALIDDDDIHTSQPRANVMLPRRPKQTTTIFSSKPTVNAVDHFDDDIEEVIL